MLVTPLTRRQWDKDHPGKIKSSLAPYAEEVRKIAAEKNVPLVDLQARSIELCESLGPEKCLEFSPPKIVNGTNAGFDGSHLNAQGHVMFSRLVVDELRQSCARNWHPVLREQPVNMKIPSPPKAKYDAVVSFDGSGTHANVQSAIDAAPDNGTNWIHHSHQAGGLSRAGHHSKNEAVYTPHRRRDGKHRADLALQC